MIGSPYSELLGVLLGAADDSPQVTAEPHVAESGRRLLISGSSVRVRRGALTYVNSVGLAYQESTKSPRLVPGGCSFSEDVQFTPGCRPWSYLPPWFILLEGVRNRHLRDGILHLVGRVDVELLRGLVALVPHQPLKYFRLQARGIRRGKRPPEIVEHVDVARRCVLVLLSAGQVDTGLPLYPGEFEPEGPWVVGPGQCQRMVTNHFPEMIDDHRVQGDSRGVPAPRWSVGEVGADALANAGSQTATGDGSSSTML